MVATLKRTSVALTKTDIQQLESLKELLGENTNQVMRRALYAFYLAYELEIKKNETV